MSFTIIKEQWSRILEQVREEHDIISVSFDTWFAPLKPYRLEKDILSVMVPQGQIALDYIQKRFTLPIKVAVAEITGLSCEIRFVLPDDVAKADMEEKKEIALINAGLNPKYTFETFVVGKNNNLAHAAALAVAENPGTVYNPLFLYGGAGLGKTHLMNSIASFILKKNPSTKLLYVTSETFTNEVIDAVRNGNSSVLSKFRDKYRNIDVLLIDDIQFIIGKDATQEEFFHTFNHLHAAGKQIILSSDRPPRDMTILEDRFRSRFEWGLMADIQTPDFETRIAILRKKQEIEGYKVPSEVITYIAENIKSNIRELEGCLNRVIALSNLERTEINIQLAEKALAAIISPNEKRVITPQYILEVVADHFKVSIEDLMGKKKQTRIVYPRQISMYLCREMTSLNFESIGKLLGGRDHSTVMYACSKIDEQLSDNEETINHIRVLKNILNS